MFVRSTHFRRGGVEGRQALSMVSDISISSAFTPAQAFWGKVTSRPERSQRELELLAWRLGASVPNTRRGHDVGVDEMAATSTHSPTGPPRPRGQSLVIQKSKSCSC